MGFIRHTRHSVPHRSASAARLGCLLAIASLTALGCHERTSPKKLTPDKLASYASLPLLRKATHRELQAELRRLEAERATPEALARPADSAVLSDGRRPTRDSRIRYTKELVKLLPPHRCRSLIAQLDREFPRAVIGPDRADQAAYAQLHERWSEFRIEAEAIMAQTDFGLYVPIDQGLLADMAIVDLVRAIVRLECLAAIVSLLEEDLPRALVAWETGGHLLGEFAGLPHAVTRAAAARARVEWLRTGQTLLEAKLVHRDTAATMLIVLEQQLSRWPPDQRALVGDRAVGLHTYELLRDGYWMSLLTMEELRDLRKRNLVEPFIYHVATQLDEDESFYLRTMRRLIAAADQPFYERQPLLTSIDKELESRSGKPEYPWFAADYLLPDLQLLQRWQAVDLELTEALRWTLHVALRQTAPTDLRSPLTGKNWQWTTDVERSTVTLEPTMWPIDDTPVRLPLFPAAQQSAQR